MHACIHAYVVDTYVQEIGRVDLYLPWFLVYSLGHGLAGGTQPRYASCTRAGLADTLAGRTRRGATRR
jgi:hypothetical protein